MLVDCGVIIVFLVGNLGFGELMIIGNFKKVFWVIIVVVGDKNGELVDFSFCGVSGKGGEVVVDGEVYIWEDCLIVIVLGVDVILVCDFLFSLGVLSVIDDVEMIELQYLFYYIVLSGMFMVVLYVLGIVVLMFEVDLLLIWCDVKYIV